ncbi:EutP/PduV family microcompartment system protein [Aminipila butyrica]|uniref:EutP/PduV family microcompartment system protein n=1 Tax=Aminipila butyrica TaxID=433296 RepID=A0A858BWS6_9FIRM|nr:EutP/PduV family microcompartment system protein [Aminipila butyrica]QIB69174.1 EutP/PduV family microcompartment system protein [Aminipila butyrica]
MQKTAKKMMMIGRSGAGKTTLCQFLNQQELAYHKTQYVQVIGENMIDTPGEYTERRSRYSSLQITSADAAVIVFVKDATEPGSIFPPGFSSMFAKPAVGVITKADLADPQMLQKAERFLKLAGAKQSFAVSCVTGEGFEELIRFIQNL